MDMLELVDTGPESGTGVAVGEAAGVEAAGNAVSVTAASGTGVDAAREELEAGGESVDGLGSSAKATLASPGPATSAAAKAAAPKARGIRLR
jgi:hypothetical protein